ncbi:MFS transporter [Streptomyces sp. CAI 127]|uniref:MFS transporter n=1 Tax=Streptomyces sp. CAI 127 TaxID=1076397 RepID=UPI001586FC4D|nr:MFS transporter [Streptomyces sp. CAI 127]NUW00921.1 MFS transporter [Streptomyces sp. CAI 127]
MAVTAPPSAPARSGLRRLLPTSPAQRILTFATFTNSFGGGMFTTASALYFTRVVGLPAEQVAIGLFGGAMAGLIAGVLVGRLADRWGPKRVHITVMLLGGAVISCFTLIGSFWSFFAVSLVAGMIIPADVSSKAPLIRAVADGNPTAFIGYLRSVINLALAFGSIVAGFAIQIDSRPAYLALVVCRALAYVGCGLILLRLPRIAAATGKKERGWTALRDRTYLSATSANAVLSLNYAVPGFLLPLWIVEHTSAPRWVVSAVLVLNMAFVVLLQVKVSRGVHDENTAGQRMAWAGVAFAAGLTLMALADGPSRWTATGLLLGGMAVFALGELWFAAASTQYCFGLAPAHLQGQYAGVFGLGSGVMQAVAPAVLSLLPLGMGLPGWLLIGALLLCVGLGSRPLVAWAGRERASA